MKDQIFSVKMVAGILFFLLLGVTAGAAGFPEKPVQVLVGWPVGSVNDLLDRAIATPLSKILRQPVIVQNIPGGGGALVLGRVKSEKPDGYALFQTGLNMYSQIPWTRSVPFDPLKDFAYLAQHARIEHYLVCRSDSPWKTFEDLIRYAKKNPKAVKYSTTGAGSSMNIMMEYLALKENLQWVHVPYSSGVEATTALLGGHVDLAALSMNLELEHIRTGRLRPLICLNDKRMTHLPELATVAEKGYDFSCVSSYIWSVPVNTSKEIQKILETALLQAFADPQVRETINKANVFYAPVGSQALTKALVADYEKYGKLMKEMGLGIFKK